MFRLNSFRKRIRGRAIPYYVLGGSLEVRMYDEFRRIRFDDDARMLLAKHMAQIRSLWKCFIR